MKVCGARPGGYRLIALLCGLVGCCAGGACGKGLVPGSAHDQPMIPAIGGNIRPRGALGAGSHPIITVLWTDPMQQHPDVPMPARSIRSTVNRSTDSDLDDTFTLDVFRPPPPEALVEVTSGLHETGLIAVGELVIVDDQNGDGEFQVSGSGADIVAPDRFLGGSYELFSYVARPFATASTGTPATFPGQQGYQLGYINCEGRTGTIGPVSPLNVQMIVQPSDSLPEVRNCGRTHSR